MSYDDTVHSKAIFPPWITIAPQYLAKTNYYEMWWMAFNGQKPLMHEDFFISLSVDSAFELSVSF